MDIAPPQAASPEEAIERFFDLRAFHPGQREAIDAVLSGRDTLVIMPTGGGKSLIYQAAALVLPGTTLVVSPLIALMRDQVEALRTRDYPGVAVLHSQIPEAEQRATLDALTGGRLKLLYVTPERCAADAFLGAARQTRISLLAVDEAHSISQWGHDFRPEYQLLDDAARAVGRPPILALTATATPAVREDIIERLTLDTPRIVVRGFDRPNLFYEVYPVADEDEKLGLLTALIAGGEADYGPPLGPELSAASGGRGIVYTALTRSAREISQWLNRHGVHAAYYHGQLKAGQRNAVQEYFTAGEVRAIAATNAFGMGIDLPDLRYVVHFDAPPSLEAYYQESGRAGRDGELARCALLFASGDLGRASFRGSAGSIGAVELEQAGEALMHAPSRGLTRKAVAEQTGLRPDRVVRALELLVAVGGARERRGRYRPDNLTGASMTEAVEREERRRAQERTKLEMMHRYAQLESCRRQFLLQYFGDYEAPDFCGMCDRCVPRLHERASVAVRVAAPPEEAPQAGGAFRAGDEVEHPSWGRGVIQHVGADSLTVHFEDAGYRTLDLATVIERDLLRPAGSQPSA